MEDGLLVFATQHHSNMYIEDDVKAIHRYVPREVGELVVLYLWLALPFVELLQLLQERQQQSTTDMGSLFVSDSDSDSDTESLDPVGSRHSKDCSSRLWATDAMGRKFSSDRFRKLLRRETRSGLRGQSLNIPEYRQVAIGISQRLMHPSSQFPQIDKDASRGPDISADENDENHNNSDFSPDSESAASMSSWQMGAESSWQTGVSSNVAWMLYARGIFEHSSSRRDINLAKFRVCSVEWHRILGFASVKTRNGLTESVLGKRRREQTEGKLPEEESA